MSTEVPHLTLVRRTACPSCGTPSAESLYSTPYDADPLRTYLLTFYEGRLDPDTLAGEIYALAGCTGCGLIYQLRIPSDSSLPVLYEHIVESERDDVEARRGDTVRRGLLRDLHRAVAYFRRPPSELQVLDFGAGTGLWLDLAAAEGCRTAGAEIDPAARAHLEASGHETFDHDALPADTFDLVNLEQVLEHVVSPTAVMTHVAQSLRPGGIARVCVPNGTNIRGLLSSPDWSAAKHSTGSLNAVAPLEHINCFDHGSLVAAGTAVGLKQFTFPFRTELASGATTRTVAGAVKQRVAPTRGTLVYFRRPV